MLLNVLPLIAGLLCMISPGLQSLRIIRTGEVAGLSVATTLLQVVNGTILTLVAFEYAVPTMLGVNVLALLMSIGVLFQVSARVCLVYVLAVAALAAGVIFRTPGLAAELRTTKWAELLTSIYGGAALITFLPQVWKMHRTHEVSAISLSTYVSLSLGLVCWTVIAILLKNTPLIVTDIVINLSVLEVIRLKLTVPRSAPRLEERVAQASS